MRGAQRGLGGCKWRKNQHRKVIDTEGKCKFLVVLLLLTYWRDDACGSGARWFRLLYSRLLFSLLINHTPTSLHKVEVNNSKYICIYIIYYVIRTSILIYRAENKLRKLNSLKFSIQNAAAI